MSEDTQTAVLDGLGDRKLSRSKVEANLGGLDAAVAHYQENATPQLILLETHASGDAVLEQLDQLAEVCDAGTNVVLMGTANDITLYRELIHRGVAEYLVEPVAPRQVLDAVTTIFEDPDAPPAGRAMAFMGSRGGAGSSTIAHNVAWFLGQEYGEEVTVIDLDVTFGTAALSFNLETQQTIDLALADPSRLDDQLLERFLVEFDENVRLLASPATLNAEEKIMTDSLDRLLDLVRRRSSFVILDIPHRWAPWVQQVLLDADETVITGVLDLSGLRDTKNLVDRLRQQRGETSPVHMVLNHHGAFKKTELSPKDFENAVEVEPDLVLIHDPNLFGAAANNGQMVGQVSGKHKAAEALRGLALTLSGRQPQQKSRKSFLSQFHIGPIGRAKAKAT
ncbi:MAG: AAA family ATPase [Alphaproteobacteria bacterium]|nr:AAA family ATPase [Alphaproteobacteria bacterium]MDP6815556.1 AAA family ATPase [Alphaproteobacteria bacterium]